MGRAPCCEKVGLKKGKWTQEEDEILANYIKAHGEGSWRSLPKKAGLLRCGKSCRLRWINYLRAGLKRGSFSTEEDELIIKLHATLGNRWSLIANELPGRTDNDIKNYWNSHLSRSIQSYNHVSRSGNTESLKPLKNSNKNVEKNNEKITQPTKQTRKKQTVHNALNPETSTKRCNENVLSSETFSSLTDEASCNSNDDILNGPFSPIILDNSDFWGLEPIEAPSDYSCTTNEVSTSKEEIINGPSSPDLSSIFKELDALLNSEITEINVEQGGHNNVSAHAENCLFVQKEARMDEEGYFGDLGCSDFLWDQDLWSSVRSLEGDLVLY